MPKIINGWFNLAKKIPSPNFDNRKPNTQISLIVIHCISLPPGVYKGNFVIDFFKNQLDHLADPYFKIIAGQKVSAHFFIRRRGVVYQFVSCYDRAWHSGISIFNGRKNCNDFSIGIELEGSDDRPFTQSQYHKLNQLIKILKHNYPITNIVGHNEIAPGRKTDPGPYFEWNKIISL